MIADGDNEFFCDAAYELPFKKLVVFFQVKTIGNNSALFSMFSLQLSSPPLEGNKISLWGKSLSVYFLRELHSYKQTNPKQIPSFPTKQKKI